MSGASSIEWTDASWSPVVGCTRVSAGCDHCYAAKMTRRLEAMGQEKYNGLSGRGHFNGVARLHAPSLDWPLRWRGAKAAKAEGRPSRIFVNPMSDLFHERLSDEEIAAVFGVMAACPQHTFQVLTKRPERARKWFEQPGIAERVDLFRHIALAGRIEEFFSPERVEEVHGWPGYFVTSKGRILSDRSKSGERVQERHEVSPMRGDQGHSRVTLYRRAETWRPLVHRLVLSTFDGGTYGSEDQGCHIDGNASNNALWNLRWGSQESNWEDSKRHGSRRRYSKLSAEQVDDLRRQAGAGASGEELGRRFGISSTQARNIVAGRQWAPEYKPEWPLRSVWLGVSVEDQAAANERIPLLLRCPAAVRFASYEPALGAVDFGRIDWKYGPNEHVFPPGQLRFIDALSGFVDNGRATRLDWLIVGGESGPGARPFDLAWARSVVEQCREAGVACFYKQGGASNACAHDRKGGHFDCFPDDLKVREFPGA